MIVSWIYKTSGQRDADRLMKYLGIELVWHSNWWVGEVEKRGRKESGQLFGFWLGKSTFTVVVSALNLDEGIQSKYASNFIHEIHASGEHWRALFSLRFFHPGNVYWECARPTHWVNHLSQVTGTIVANQSWERKSHLWDPSSH